MSVYWEQHLNDIREELLMMSGLTERSLSQSVRALLERDDSLADLVEAEDSEIDELEKRIDEKVVTYISTHGPMARDCRFLITASKIASGLRIRRPPLRVGHATSTGTLRCSPWRVFL